MKRILLTAAAVAFATLLVAGIDAEANTTKSSKGHPSTHNRVHVGTTIRINSNHVRCHVRDYRGWNRYCWFGQQRCYGYYCPAERLWFYWYAPMARYLPISYMAIYPPTPLAVAPVGPGTPIGPVGPVTPPQGAPGGLPPGATPVQNPPMAPPAAPTNESTPVEQ